MVLNKKREKSQLCAFYKRYTFSVVLGFAPRTLHLQGKWCISGAMSQVLFASAIFQMESPAFAWDQLWTSVLSPLLPMELGGRLRKNLTNSSPRLDSKCNPHISASQVAGVTDVSHHTSH
jgi:hypothetical protein